MPKNMRNRQRIKERGKIARKKERRKKKER